MRKRDRRPEQGDEVRVRGHRGRFRVWYLDDAKDHVHLHNADKQHHVFPVSDVIVTRLAAEIET